MKFLPTLICMAALALLPACSSTVTPVQVHATQPSFDGNQQNSGFIQFNADGSGLITAHARDRYNDLISRYSKQFMPPLQPDDGLKQSGTNWIIDDEHLNDFKKMNRWRKENK